MKIGETAIPGQLFLKLVVVFQRHQAINFSRLHYRIRAPTDAFYVFSSVFVVLLHVLLEFLDLPRVHGFDFPLEVIDVMLLLELLIVSKILPLPQQEVIMVND